MEEGKQTETGQQEADGMKIIHDDTFVAAHSPNNKPVMRAESGEILQFETRDCYNRSVKDPTKTLSEQTKDQPENPATGPLFVEGAEPGDVLAVDILDIQVADCGVVAVGSGPFREESPDAFCFLKIRDGRTAFHGLEIPIDPMIGVIGTAMADRDVPTMLAYEGGGNMDCRLIRQGATVWLPVRVPGALLSIGDLHAVMGDGEVDGTGLEVDGVVTVRVRLFKGETLNWPVTETRDAWYVDTCGDTCDDAIREGYRELRRLLSAAWGWSLQDAGIYMTLQCFVESNQACLVPNNTFGWGCRSLQTCPG